MRKENFMEFHLRSGKIRESGNQIAIRTNRVQLFGQTRRELCLVTFLLTRIHSFDKDNCFQEHASLPFWSSCISHWVSTGDTSCQVYTIWHGQSLQLFIVIIISMVRKLKDNIFVMGTTGILRRKSLSSHLLTLEYLLSSNWDMPKGSSQFWIAAKVHP